MIVVFWLALSHRVYNHTLPMRLIERVFGEDADEGPFAVHVVLRKLYSIVAFALIGFVAHRALPPARRPALRAALVVAAFSAAIEVAQKLRAAPEGLVSNAVDVACGALGGWLAIAVPRLIRRRPKSAP
ncbi:MAG TPA: hypothetical protein VGD01_14200 [Candidatus Elarobacter sp.]